MTNRIGMAAPVLLLATVFTLTAPLEGVAQPTGTIVARVYSAVDGSGLASMPLTLTGPTSESAITDLSGRCTFTNLPPGTYSVTLGSAPGDAWIPELFRQVNVAGGGTATADFAVYSTVITLTVNQALGTVVADPDPLPIVRGQPITWVVTNPDAGAVTIQFDPISPVSTRKLMAARDERELLTTQVRRYILPGRYKYFVAVELDGRIYTEDPELIDENGEEPPGTDTTEVRSSSH